MRNENADSKHIYLEEIKKIPLLTKEEEKILFKAYKNGSMEALNKLYESNLPLVVSIAKRLSNTSPYLDFLDVVQEGNLGLRKAIEYFDVDKGCKFSTYATPCIEQYIKKAIYDFRIIKIPCDIVRRMRNLSYIKEQFIIEHGRNPTEIELAVKMNLSVKTIKKIYKLTYNIVSLDSNVDGEDDLFLKDCVFDENFDFEKDLVDKTAISDILIYLNEQQLLVIKLRFGLEDDRIRTLGEISKIMNCTPGNIWLIEKKALEILKEKLLSKNKIKYLK